MAAISTLAGVSVFANAPSFFPIYGTAFLEDAAGEAAAQGQELRSLLRGFGIHRKEAAKTLGTTRGELLRWCWGVHRLPQQLLPVLRMARNRREASMSLGQLQGWHWDRFKKNHPFWREALELRTAMRDWNLSAEDICDATGLSAEDFDFLLRGSINPGKKWQEELRSLRDLKRSKSYWREAEKLRMAMEKWGISVQDIIAATGMSHNHILCCKNGINNPHNILSAFQGAVTREEVLAKLTERVQERRERRSSGLSFPFHFDTPHNRMVREIRLHLGITKKEMAFALGVSRCTIDSWERGFQSVSPPAQNRIEYAAKMQTGAALLAASKKWESTPIIVHTPRRPLSSEEQSLAASIFNKNESRIRSTARRMFWHNREGDVEEMASVVMEEVSRVILSKRISQYLHPVTGLLYFNFIRRILLRWLSKFNLQRKGLKLEEQVFLNRMREIEGKWQTLHGRMITPEEFAQEFKVTVARAEQLLEEYRLLSQVRPVSYEVLQIPLAGR